MRYFNGAIIITIVNVLIPNFCSAQALNSEFFKAVKDGKTEKVETSLQKGADPNSTDKEGRTALMVACQEGYIEIAKVLVENGADINAKDNQGLSPLLLASYTGNVELAKYLINKGADVHAINSTGGTSLILASHKGSVKLVELLLKHKATINKQVISGLNALMFASQNGHLDVVKLLLKKGADVNSEANPSQTSFSSRMRTLAMTPLIYASKSGHTEITRLLLEKGADANASSAREETPYLVAANPEIVDLLRKHGVTEQAENKYGMTRLMYASMFGNLKMTKHLISLGVNVNAKQPKTNLAALLVAVKHGHTEIAKLLLKNRANVNDRDAAGNSALLSACVTGKTELTQALIEAGAEINISNKSGKTPLIYASRDNQTDILKILLAGGADMHAKDLCERTALTFALSNHNLESESLLRAHGATGDSTELVASHVLISLRIRGIDGFLADLDRKGTAISIFGHFADKIMTSYVVTGVTYDQLLRISDCIPMKYIWMYVDYEKQDLGNKIKISTPGSKTSWTDKDFRFDDLADISLPEFLVLNRSTSFNFNDFFDYARFSTDEIPKSLLLELKE